MTDEQKEIRRKRSKLWRENNKDKYNADAKTYRENNRDYYTNKATARNRTILRGFTQERYDAVIIEQEYKCAICGTPRSELSQDFAADHNHTTNEPRGLLCKSCNVGLGMFRDSISNLASAIEYLDKYK
jgi:hypothetical protein